MRELDVSLVEGKKVEERMNKFEHAIMHMNKMNLDCQLTAAARMFLFCTRIELMNIFFTNNNLSKHLANH